MSDEIVKATEATGAQTTESSVPDAPSEIVDALLDEAPGVKPFSERKPPAPKATEPKEVADEEEADEGGVVVEDEEAPAPEETEEAPGKAPEFTPEELDYLMGLRKSAAAKELASQPPAPEPQPQPTPQPAPQAAPPAVAPAPQVTFKPFEFSEEAREGVLNGDFAKFTEEFNQRRMMDVQEVLMAIPQVTMQTLGSRAARLQNVVEREMDRFLIENPEVEEIEEEFSLAVDSAYRKNPSVDLSDRRQLRDLLKQAKQEVAVALSVREKLKAGAAKKIDARGNRPPSGAPGTSTQGRINPSGRPRGNATVQTFAELEQLWKNQG